MAQWVRDLALSLLWLGLLLWHGFDPWPGNFHMLCMWQKKKKKKKEEEEEEEEEEKKKEVSPEHLHLSDSPMYYLSFESLVFSKIDSKAIYHTFNLKELRRSCCGSAVMTLTSILEDTGLLSGLAQ